MPLFEYKAVAPTGETVQGTMEAASVDAVVLKLQEAGNVPLQARESGGGFSLGGFSIGRRSMNPREVAEFTQQLATLLGAGLPLDRSLQVLLELAESDRVKRAMSEIRDKVREGGSLSDALDEQHGAFNRLFINMVRAGEVGGSLDVTLARLTEYLERSRDLKDSVISALIYPVLLLMLAAGSLILLLVYVIPQFTPIFEELGGDLPFITKVVLGVGAVLQNFWWLIAILVAAAVWWFRRMLADAEKRFAWDTRVLATRWVGDLVAKMETARLTRTLGTLLTNGVPLLSALSIAKNVMTNTVLKGDVEQAAKQVKTGAPLARALSHQPEILCLDEFSIAIDPVTTMKIEDILRELKSEMTIVVGIRLATIAPVRTPRVRSITASTIAKRPLANISFSPRSLRLR